MKLVKLTVLTMFVALAAPVTLRAEPPPAELRLAQAGGKSLEDAIRSVQRQHGGRIVSASTSVRNGREIHTVRVLTANGDVRTVRVNGRKVGRN